MNRTPKQRKCSGCGFVFQPDRMGQKACSPRCAQVVARNLLVAEQRGKDRARLKQLMSRSEHLKLAQKAFNAFVRARDADLPCIACGKYSTGSIRYAEGQRHASHYLSVGSHPELRFDPDNVHAGCSRCNTMLAGNIAAYRIGLIARIGLARVERLEGPHPASKWTIPELQELTTKYNRLARELSKPMEKAA